MKLKNKAVYLDRDGTIIPWENEILRSSQMKPYKKASKALALLRSLGYKLIVITNQPPIEKGRITLSQAKKLNGVLDRNLGKKAKLDAYYICPHRFTTKCVCRKPSPHFVNIAAKRFNIDLKESFFVGDTTRDVQTGKNAKIRTILVRTGKGGEGEDKKFFKAEADHVVRDIYSAAKLIEKLDSEN